MTRAGLAIVLAALVAGCSQPVGRQDIPGVYRGTLADGQTYRLEMSEGLDYRFCRPDDAKCADPEHLGSYQVVRLGAKSIVRFPLLCITPDGACATYEAGAKRTGRGSLELDFVDAAGVHHVFVKHR
ncbi:hypothetical protein [Alteriqipengyuania sp. 357]